MKLSIDLSDTIADHEWGTSVAETIRDEIISSVRKAVASEVKAQNDQIKREAQRVVRQALAELKSEKIQALTKKIVREM